MDKTEQLKIIEQNALGHFAFLPTELGFDTHEIDYISVINCGFGSSMFNIAYGAPLGCAASDAILNIKKAFKGQPFAWWIPPSQHNPEFTKSLLDHNLLIETIEHAMICDLAKTSSFQQKTDLLIKSVTNTQLLQDFISVLEPYDQSVRSFYERVKIEHLNSQEKLFVGYVLNKPVTIGILFISKQRAGIFSLLTDDSLQGRGYGTDMMVHLIHTAKRNHCHYVTLSASSDSGYRIYERLGFQKVGEFECFEYKGD